MRGIGFTGLKHGGCFMVQSLAVSICGMRSLQKFTTSAKGLKGLKPEKPKLLRVDQIAARLNVSKSKAYDLVSQGYFKALRISDTGKGGIRVTEESLNSYIANRLALFALEKGILRDED
jgi:excisionase family DNA binding protein